MAHAWYAALFSLKRMIDWRRSGSIIDNELQVRTDSGLVFLVLTLFEMLTDDEAVQTRGKYLSVSQGVVV